MSKYQEVTDSFTKLFEEIKDNKTTIPEFVEFKLLHSPQQRSPIFVSKASAVVKHLNNIEVLVFVNEDIMDKLEEPQQTIIIEEALAQVHYDSEKDRINILKPDLVTFSGIVKKYGDEYFRTFEILRELLAQKDDQEKTAKASKKKGN